jgi:hypothetical protein
MFCSLIDAAPYIVKAAKSIKAIYSRMVRVTCLAHALHRVGEEVRTIFPKLTPLCHTLKNLPEGSVTQGTLQITSSQRTSTRHHAVGHLDRCVYVLLRQFSCKKICRRYFGNTRCYGHSDCSRHVYGQCHRGKAGIYKGKFRLLATNHYTPSGEK